MPKYKYVISLKQAHDKLGLSPYMVSKRSGVSVNTVAKYAEFDNVVIDQLSVAVAALCEFYGVKFHKAVKVVRLPNGNHLTSAD